MEKKLILCDTNIIIEFYKGNQVFVEKLRKIGLDNIVISSITLAELVFGALNKMELNTILKDSKALRLISINETVSHIFLELMTEYSLSHRLSIPDALIASTAIVNDLELFTLNLKDFRFIKGLRLY